MDDVDREVGKIFADGPHRDDEAGMIHRIVAAFLRHRGVERAIGPRMPSTSFGDPVSPTSRGWNLAT